MAKNCAMSPRQFMLSYCLLACASLLVAGVCAATGVWAVLPFAGAELVFVAILFVLYARHAADYDKVELSSERLFIECSDGPHFERYEFNPHWTAVALQSVPDPRIEIRYAGRCLLVGSHVPVHQRAIIASELRRSLGENLATSVPSPAAERTLTSTRQ